MPFEAVEFDTDSPWYRLELRNHENLLHQSKQKIKNFCSAAQQVSAAVHALSAKQFELASAIEAFDDLDICGDCGSIKPFYQLAVYLREITEAWCGKNSAWNSFNQMIDREKGTIEQIRNFLNTDRKSFEKSSSSYDSFVEKNLHGSAAKKKEADVDWLAQQIEERQRDFKTHSKEYMHNMIMNWSHIRTKLLQTPQGVVTDLCNKMYSSALTSNELESKNEKLENLRETMSTVIKKFKSTEIETMNNWNFDGQVNSETSHKKQGWLYLVKTDKKMPLPLSAPTKTFCVFQMQSKVFSTVSLSSSNSGWTGSQSTTSVKASTTHHTMARNEINASQDRLDSTSNSTPSQPSSAPKASLQPAAATSIVIKYSDTVEEVSRVDDNDSVYKRFMISVKLSKYPEPFLFQALSDSEMKSWLSTLSDGKTQSTPPQQHSISQQSSIDVSLDDTGFKFLVEAMKYIEKDDCVGEQGLYRNCGVNSKVQLFLQDGLIASVPMEDDEAELKTVTGAIKLFLRSLRFPLIPFNSQLDFISATRRSNEKERLLAIHDCVDQLPDVNYKFLKLLMKHLDKIAENSFANLMSVPNLAICFGPTLMRAEDANIESIGEGNLVVELLIDNYLKIFDKPHPVDASTSNHNNQRLMPNKPPHAAASMITSPSTSSASNGMSPIKPPEYKAQLSSAPTTQRATANQSSLNNPPHPLGPQNTPIAPPRSERMHRKNSPEAIHDPSSPRSAFYMTTYNAQHSVVVDSTPQHLLKQPGPKEMSRSMQDPQVKQRPACVATSSNDSLDTGSSTHSLTNNNDLADRRSTSVSQSSINHINAFSSYGCAYQAEKPKRYSVGEPTQSRRTQTTAFSYLYRGKIMPYQSIVRDANATPITTTTTTVKDDHENEQLNPNSTIPSTNNANHHVSVSTLLYDSAFSTKTNRVRTLYECKADNDSELSFTAGQIITNVVHSKEPGWIMGTLNGKTGLVPQNYVQFC